MHYKINLLLNKYLVGYWDISWVKRVCWMKERHHQWKSDDKCHHVNGKFRTEPLFYSSGATDVHVRAAGYVSSSSKSATSSWIGGESLYIDTYILFSRIHSFIIYQISLTDCKVCIITCLTPSCSLFAPCSVVLAWFMIYAFCTEIIGAFIEDNEWSFSSVSWFNHTGKKIGKHWQVTLNSWLTNLISFLWTCFLEKSPVFFPRSDVTDVCCPIYIF